MSLIWGQGVFGQGVFGGGDSPAIQVGASFTPSTQGYTASIALDPLTHDLSLSSLKIIRGDEAIEQKVRQVLRFFQGEWFLDTRLGVPYHQKILGQKNPNLPAIASIFRRALLKVQQIKSVQSLSINLDRATRNATVDFVALIEDGRTLTAKAESFIV